MYNADCRVLKTPSERIRELELALTAALQYLPREKYVGGVGNGSYEPSGPAVLKIIHQAEEALDPYV